LPFIVFICLNKLIIPFKNRVFQVLNKKYEEQYVWIESFMLHIVLLFYWHFSFFLKDWPLENVVAFEVNSPKIANYIWGKSHQVTNASSKCFFLHSNKISFHSKYNGLILRWDIKKLNVLHDLEKEYGSLLQKRVDISV